MLLITSLGTTIGARNGNRLVGVVLVVMAVYGFVLGDTLGERSVALTFADNLFHAIIGVVLLLTAFGATTRTCVPSGGPARLTLPLLVLDAPSTDPVGGGVVVGRGTVVGPVNQRGRRPGSLHVRRTGRTCRR